MPYNVKCSQYRVHPDVQEVLSEYILDLHLSANLLDPLRLEVTRHDGTLVNCVAVIKESEDEGLHSLTLFSWKSELKTN